MKKVLGTALSFSVTLGVVMSMLAYTAEAGLYDPFPGFPGLTTLVSLKSDRTLGNSHSYRAAISANGRFVAFHSFASTLVPRDTNNSGDIFVHDRLTGITKLVSVDSNGNQGDGTSVNPSLSADGQHVAFHSNTTNLVPDDNNYLYDVFFHDRLNGITTRVSIASDGAQAEGPSYDASISGDGRLVAFTSLATNLVAGDNNAMEDIFVHDRVTGATTRVSVASDGTQGNGYSYRAAISANGRYVAFVSDATNLVAGDTNGGEDVFVHDRLKGITTRVNVASDGTQGSSNEPVFSDRPLSISADGRYVAFESVDTNLVAGDSNGYNDIFVHDLEARTTTRVSVNSDGDQGNYYSYSPSISPDGRYVAFASDARNLVPGTGEPWGGDGNLVRDIFIHDRQTGTTSLANVGNNGFQGDSASYYPSISADGRYVAFETHATNIEQLWGGDTNGVRDIYVHAPQIAWYRGELFRADFEEVSFTEINAWFSEHNNPLPLQFVVTYPINAPFPRGLPAYDNISHYNGYLHDFSNMGGVTTGFGMPDNVVVPFRDNYLSVTKALGDSRIPVVNFVPDLTLGPYAAGVYTVSWQSAFEHAADTNGRFLLVDNAGRQAFTLGYDSNGFNFACFIGGCVALPGIYLPSIPSTFSAVVNLDTRVTAIYKDGVFAAGGGLIDSGFSDLQRLSFMVAGDNSVAESYYIDNIRMYRGADFDGDGVADSADNCPSTYNPDQADTDGDGDGDLCDSCPTMHDPSQGDSDGDGIGNVCDTDRDNDGIADKDALEPGPDGEPTSFGLIPIASGGDGCPADFNIRVDWVDIDETTHDNSQPDYDLDGIFDDCDNCPAVANPDQHNRDGDQFGDACDDADQQAGKNPPPSTCTVDNDTPDHDGVCGSADNCPSDPNPAPQADTDGDGVGDVCDSCPALSNANQAVPVWYKDADGDRYSDATRATACTAPALHYAASALTALSGDCDDGNPARNPGLTESTGNGIDDDCNVDTPDTLPAYQVVFEMTGYDGWLPTDVATAEVQSRVVETSTGNTVPGATFTSFTLSAVSNWAGSYTNDENLSTADDFILRVTDSAAGRFSLDSRDFGGSAVVRVLASLPGGAVASGNFKIPKDSDNDGLPDAWEGAHGTLAKDEDIDTSVGNPYTGDGLTNFEEYRGFWWDTLEEWTADTTTYKTKTLVPTGSPHHFRTNPTRKDLFVEFRNYLQDNPSVSEGFALGDAFRAVGVDVHAVDSATSSVLGERNIDVVSILNVLTIPYQGTDGNINKRGVRDWTWDTKGASGVGDATSYGSNTATYRIPLVKYFTQYPYREAIRVGTFNVLDPVGSVEDRNDNGTDDRVSGVKESTTIVNDSVLDGDLYIVGSFTETLSPFDIDKNGLVELPLASTVGQIGTTTLEYTQGHALKHTITHEIGHAVGIPHTQVTNCLMYEFSPDWKRDSVTFIDGGATGGGFSDIAKSFIRIHND